MTTKNDTKNVTEVSSTDSQAKPRISLRREKVKALSARTGVQTGRFHCGCIFESILD